MHDKFLEFYNNEQNRCLFKTEELFVANRKSYEDDFKKEFVKICEEIVKMQSEETFGEIAYLEFTLLHLKIMNRDYSVEVRVYDNDWYLSKNQKCIGSIKIDYVYKYFEELWNELLLERKRYVGAVTALEISEKMVNAVPKFYDYMISLIRFSILDIIEESNFKEIKKSSKFEINVGQYMGDTEAVYKENMLKDRDEISEWFKKKLEFESAFEDFTGLDFSGEDLSDMDFRYSDLRNTKLIDTDLTDSMLFGTRFNNADMENANLSYGLLYEADFTNANLKNAKLRRVLAMSGILDERWEVAGYIGVSFRNANLENADFTHSNFYGADFTNAIMKGAKFNQSHIEELNLSKEQLESIVIV